MIIKKLKYKKQIKTLEENVALARSQRDYFMRLDAKTEALFCIVYDAALSLNNLATYSDVPLWLKLKMLFYIRRVLQCYEDFEKRGEQ